MRRTATWQHGFAPPHVRDYIDWCNERNREWPELQLRHEDVSTKLVDHGESRYALVVEPDDADGLGDRAAFPFRWGIHRQVGPDADDPDHWERVDPEYLDQQYGGLLAGDKDEGMEAAEEAWEDITRRQKAQRDRNLDRGLDDHREPEGGYDIFGERP